MQPNIDSADNNSLLYGTILLVKRIRERCPYDISVTFNMCCENHINIQLAVDPDMEAIVKKAAISISRGEMPSFSQHCATINIKYDKFLKQIKSDDNITDEMIDEAINTLKHHIGDMSNVIPINR